MIMLYDVSPRLQWKPFVVIMLCHVPSHMLLHFMCNNKDESSYIYIHMICRGFCFVLHKIKSIIIVLKYIVYRKEITQSIH
jgi:hypothetical protein